jgi:hypothetical protein
MSKHTIDRREEEKVNRVKWSFRNCIIRNLIPSTSQNPLLDAYGWVVVPPVEAQGVRKAKNFRVSGTVMFIWGASGSSMIIAGNACPFVIVYIRAGLKPPIFGTSSMYDATGQGAVGDLLSIGQGDVLVSGMVGGPMQEFTSPLARNLNSGDSIWFAIDVRTSENYNHIKANFVISYSICNA